MFITRNPFLPPKRPGHLAALLEVYGHGLKCCQVPSQSANQNPIKNPSGFQALMNLSFYSSPLGRKTNAFDKSKLMIHNCTLASAVLCNNKLAVDVCFSVLYLPLKPCCSSGCATFKKRLDAIKQHVYAKKIHFILQFYGKK